MRVLAAVAVAVAAIGDLPVLCCNAFNIQQQRGHDNYSYRHHHRKMRSHHHQHQLQVAANNALEGIGMPSTPGWESGRLNRLTEWADSAKPNRPIICEYIPKGQWLWRKWNGTVLKATWKSVVFAMLAGLALDFIARGGSLSSYKKLSWDMAAVPSATDPMIKRLSMIGKVWEYHLTLSTFILTFFLSHAFSYWQKVYNTTRMIQGRINGELVCLFVGLLLCLFHYSLLDDSIAHHIK